MRSLLLTLAISGLLVTLQGCSPSGTGAAGGSQSVNVPDVVDFNWHVRQILSNNCFQCHGPDAAARQAGLRLDDPVVAMAELLESPGRHAIVPGEPQRSMLVERIRHADPEQRMPPLESRKSLSHEEMAILEAWIEQGAHYKPHWSLLAPRAGEPEETPFDDLAHNAIDRYVFAGLDAAGLAPSPEADRETLINRATLSLIGLPPTLDEVDAFIADTRSDAFARLVDRLLESSRYGERMAVEWLDVARYSESDGFLDDLHERFFWPWRDWVIEAFNENMPYHEFSRWQLAGDLLPNPADEQILATAFGRLGKRSTENGIIDEEYRVEYMAERGELVGSAFLGLTVGCAKCHDHKYDAISQADYYSLAAFFNSIDERGFYAPGRTGHSVGPTLLWPDDETEQALAAVRATLAALTEQESQALVNARDESQERARFLAADSNALAAELEASLDAHLVAHYPLDRAYRGSVEHLKQPNAFGPGVSLQNGLVEQLLTLSPSTTPGMPEAVFQEANLRPGHQGEAFFVTADNKGFLGADVGYYERSDAFSIDLWIFVPDNRDFTDATIFNHRNHGVFVGDTGYTLNIEGENLRFDLIHLSPYNMISVYAGEPVPRGAWSHVTVTYDGSSSARGVGLYLNGEPLPLEVRKDNLFRTILPTPGIGAAGFDAAFYGFAFGRRFRAEVFAEGAVDEIRVFDSALTPLEVEFLHHGTAGFASTPTHIVVHLAERAPAVQSVRAELVEVRAKENLLMTATPQIMVLGDVGEARQAYLLERGLYNQRGRPVQPQGLSEVLEWNDSLPRNRLGLVDWLFDPDNPLTARVFVNRLWQMHFGTGLVATPEDFGTQGALPTHPELLDWLAIEFIESGWDIKHMHRLMVTSATYRQSSTASPDSLTKDPENLLLSRGYRQRLPAEVIRDRALAVSGLLVDEIGGPSRYPYQPPGVWEATLSFLTNSWPEPDAVPVDDHHGRTLYTFVKRNAPPPSMMVFDFADRNVSTVKRTVSNTPLQALVLLNDPQYVETYKWMAHGALEAAADPDNRLAHLFRAATRREAAPEELDLIREYYDQARARYAETPAEARRLLDVGVRDFATAEDIPELAALTLVAGAVMNTPDAYSMR